MGERGNPPGDRQQRRTSGQPLSGGEAFYLRNVAYADHGAVERQQLGNELWEFIAYNDRLQPADMRLGTTQDGSQVWRSRLSYDPAGGSCTGQSGGWQLITAPLDAGGDLTLCQTYGYDNFNRLTATQEAGGWSRLNSYDAFGNRTVNVGPALLFADTC